MGAWTASCGETCGGVALAFCFDQGIIITGCYSTLSQSGPARTSFLSLRPSPSRPYSLSLVDQQCVPYSKQSRISRNARGITIGVSNEEPPLLPILCSVIVTGEQIQISSFLNSSTAHWLFLQDSRGVPKMRGGKKKKNQNRCKDSSGE